MSVKRVMKVGVACWIIVAGLSAGGASAQSGGEVRSVWISATDEALAAPTSISPAMEKLSEMGFNTVYADVQSGGRDHFQSATAKRVLGLEPESRNLLEETLINAHRFGLVYAADFRSGFVLGPKGCQSQLPKLQAEWLSRDAQGSEVAPDGMVWLNPIHPQARRYLIDLVLEAIARYDIDSVQFDEHIAWPDVSMGYDDFTKKAYAKDHNGKEPPANARDEEWMRWRADRVNEFAKMLAQEARAKRPGLVISITAGMYPATYEQHLLEWPKWAAWKESDALKIADNAAWAGQGQTPRWDEFVPQCFRADFESFRSVWLEQLRYINELGGARIPSVVAGIRLDTDGKPETWPEVQKSIEVVRRINSAGHAVWSLNGVLGPFASPLAEFYSLVRNGHAAQPFFGPKWRTPSTDIFRVMVSNEKGEEVWAGGTAGGTWRPVALDGDRWVYIDRSMFTPGGKVEFTIPPTKYIRMEILRDRRPELAQPRKAAP